MEIITNPNISLCERNGGRLHFLKLLSYHANNTDHRNILDWYDAWLRRFELGQRTWDDNPKEIEYRCFRAYNQYNTRKNTNNRNT